MTLEELKKERGSIEILESVGSTNNYLKEKAPEITEDGYVVIADRQTAGKGRLGRTFVSPSKIGLYLSMLVFPGVEASKALTITGSVAVAAMRAVEKTCGERPDIKWLNDLYMGGRKICGILCEMTMSGNEVESIIMGIGININNRPEDFPEDVRNTAGSIAMHTGKTFSRDDLAANLICELDTMYRRWLSDSMFYLGEYRENCINVGKNAYIVNGSDREKVFVEGIDDDFTLIVRSEDGKTRNVSGGDVSLRF